MTDSPTRTRPAAVTRPPRTHSADVPEVIEIKPRKKPLPGAIALPAIIPGLLMLAFGLVQAGRPVLSWDEVTSAEVSQRSVGQILDLVQNIDAVFGFYYVFLHFWSDIAGTSEVALRLPSIVAMAGGVAVAAELGRRLFSPAVGLTTGLILCLIPNTSRYAAEARPYAFACFFSVLAMLLLVAAVRRGHAYRWVGYGLSVALLGLSHLLALTTLVAHAALIAMVMWRRRRRRRTLALTWGGTVCVALLPVLPIAWLGAHQEDTQLHWVEPITFARIRAMPWEMFGSRELAWMVIGLAVLASWRPMRRLVPMAALVLGPMLTLAAVSALVSPMWVARYLLVVLAPLAMLAAVALVGRGERSRVIVVLLLLAFVALPGQHKVREPAAKVGPDYRAAARIVGEFQQPGDVIVYPPKNRALRAGMDYYLNRLPAKPADPLVDVPSAETGWLIATEYPAAGHLNGAKRIWMVVGDRRADALTARGELRPMIDKGYQRIGFWQPKRATVALYEQRG
ncbi:mannosyltransferase [Actinoplanes lutulentus]|uniref:Mannosyltransferase n=1 Tax=Actinoplanes lutulentus TaxID=1287878 RepID=A0A327ZHV5_9ACTN|nr:glycosyltransferase family 39 protein [Actinoplanes lutulentus]MBB2944305.1 mannosyltransferase [Actinoplanes lutulentus]RAK42462.1 mannosyltransferase [Actinoplanes lutulentus]